MNGFFSRPSWMAALLAALLALSSSACTQPPANGMEKSSSGVPASYQAAARSALGDDAKVVLFGDLSRNGHIQLLVVNPLPNASKDSGPGLSVSRAAILENDPSGWREIFLADEHLKNSEGFLGGTPLGSVNAWRLQYDRQPAGLAMVFTPIEPGTQDRPSPIAVRWNPATHRYQSLSRDLKTFVAETQSLRPAPEFKLQQ